MKDVPQLKIADQAQLSMTPTQRKLRAWMIGLAAAVGVYALVGFFLVPRLARKQLVDRGSEALHREVVVGEVYFNPFTFFVQLDTIRLEGKGEPPLATFASASLNFNPIASLFQQRWQFGTITIAAPNVRVVVDEDGQLNLFDLFPPSDEPSEPPPIGIEQLIIENGTIAYSDYARSEPFATTVTPVALTLTDFSTEPDEFGNYRLTGTTAAGRSFSWNGQMAVAPFSSRGRVTFEYIDIPTFMPFLTEFLAAEVRSGGLAFEGNYDFSLGDARHATLSDFTVQATNLVVAMPDSDRPVVELASATIEVRKAQLLDRSAQIARITLEGLAMRVEREADGTVNVSRLLAASPTAEGQTSGAAENKESRPHDPAASENPGKQPTDDFALRIETLELRNGTVRFVDHSLAEPFAMTVSPVEFTLENFSTVSGDPGGRYRLTGQTDNGGNVLGSGTITTAPMASRGTLKLEQFSLGAYTPFFADLLQGEIRSGTVTLAASYDLFFGADRHATVSDATWRITDLVVAKTASEQPMIEVPVFTGELQQASVFDQTAQVARVALDGVVMRLERAPDGTLNLARLFARPSASENNPEESRREEAASAGATENDRARDDHVRIANFVFQNGTVIFTDQTVPDAVRVRAENIQFTATGVSSDLEQDVGIDLSLQWAGGPGVIKATGTVRPQSLQAELHVSGSDLELPPLGPYLQPIIAVQLVSGRATFDGTIEGSQPQNGPLVFRWVGRAAIDDIDLRDAQLGHELAKWRQLAMDESELTTQPLRLTAREVSFRGPVLHVMRAQDGSINLSAILNTADEGASGGDADAAKLDEALPFQVRIDQLVVSEGGITFSDRSIDPEFTTAITQLEGGVLGLSSEPGAAAQVELKGILAGAASLAVSGEINLLADDMRSNSEVRLDLTDLPIDPFESYVKRYLGYKIEQGKIRGDFEYSTAQGQLDGTNRIVLENLSLGESVESPDAISVPLKLALAVLRNRQDEVVLNVDVSGSLQAPEFDLGQIIQRAFRNVLVKAATAPFSVLGSLFGFKEEDLKAAEFLPGEAIVGEAAEKRLDALAQVLNDRPGLAVVINWRAMEAVDRGALTEKRLRQLIQQEREVLAVDASDRGAADVTEAEAIRLLVRRRLPEAAVQLADRGEDAGSSAQENQSPWFVRLFSSIFGRRGDTAGQSDAETSAAQGGDIADLRQQLLGSLNVSPSDYRELARSRAVAAREYLIAAGIDPHRAEIGEAPSQADQSETIPADPPDRALVFFELTEMQTLRTAASR